MSKRTLYGAALWAGLVFLASAPLGAGCSKPPATPPDATVSTPPDASGGGADASAPSPDVGSPDTGPEPIACTYDDDCPADMRCADNGACMPAIPCQTPANCAPSDENDTIRLYCENATVGLGCRCVAAPAGDAGVAGAAGSYCKRRLPPCAPCTTDEQCGTDPLYFQTPLHEPGKCVELDGAKVCLEPYVKAKCGCGMSATVGTASYCAPQGAKATCAEGGAFLCCAKDANCPPEHPLCETATGRCQDVCWYDFEKKETIGCRADRVCNVDPKFLTPTSHNYGAGRCGPPCAADTDCSYLRGDFVCRAEAGSDQRCRPPGCLGDIECPALPVDNPSNGFCERETGDCKPNCRVGEDPMTSLPFKDCKDGFVCEQPTPLDPAGCRPMTCIEQGGAQIYCSWNELCCGEDRDGDVTTAPEACPVDAAGTQAEKGKCYRAPNPPWCAACDPQDAMSCTKAGYPTSDKDDNFCIGFGADADGNDRGNACLFACKSSKECPKGFFCKDMPVYCNDQEDICGDPARCVETDIVLDPTTNPPTMAKYCKCSTAGAKDECPALDPAATDPNSPHARCADDVSPGNSPWLHCIWTHACTPYITACTPPL